MSTHFFLYRQLHFSSEPGVANEFWEKKAESCLVVACIFNIDLEELAYFRRNQLYFLIWGWAVASELLSFWPKSQART